MFAYQRTGGTYQADGGNWPLYRMIITQGPHKGECVGRDLGRDPDGRLARAIPCEKNTSFVMPNYDDGKKGHVIPIMTTTTPFIGDGRFSGNRAKAVFDTEEGKGNIALNEWNGHPNQVFNYRPIGYKV